MDYKNSLINMSLYKNIIRRHKNPAKISLIAFFACFLLRFVDNFSFFSVLSPITFICFIISAMVLPTIYPGYIQGYLVDKNASKHTESLPISKFSMWLTHYLAGLMLTIVPLMIEVTMLAFSPYDYDFSPEKMMLTTFILTIIYYTIAHFATMIAGNRFGQLVFTVSLYALPTILVVGLQIMGVLLVAGANLSSKLNNLAYMLLPLRSGIFFALDGWWREWPFLKTQVFLTILLLVGSYFIYKRRSNETIGQFMMFDVVAYFIKGCLVLSAAMGFFCILVEASDLLVSYRLEDYLLPFIIFLLGGLLVGFVLELLTKSGKEYAALPIYGILLCLGFVGSYFIGNQSSNQTLNALMASKKSEIMIYQEYFDYNIQDFDHQIIKQFIEDNKDKFQREPSYDDINKQKIYHISFNLSEDEYLSYDMYIKSEDFTNYVKEHVQWQELLEIDESVFQQKQLVLTDNWSYYDYVVLPDLIKQLETYYKNTKEFMPVQSYQYIDESGKQKTFSLDDKMVQILEEGNASILAGRLNECLDYIYDTEHYELEDVIVRNFENIFYAEELNEETTKSITKISMNQIALKATIVGEDQGKEKKMSILFTFSYDEKSDMMVLESMKGG